jgi:hypothetical protein
MGCWHGHGHGHVNVRELFKVRNSMLLTLHPRWTKDYHALLSRTGPGSGLDTHTLRLHRSFHRGTLPGSTNL